MHALPSQKSRIPFLFIPSQQIENPFPTRNNACTTKPIIKDPFFFSFLSTILGSFMFLARRFIPSQQLVTMHALPTQ
ncbi:hypothetical protein CARUB_v10021565mg [Capsella rubella]|uniref:Uncharacterized protein n=1 Tax=Capsella rubella TaxID=81985 RepID=R0GEL4_9BRAS|nr:hypothetical protein CARUB_v10021565mg [Capsella rubella]